jgi:hypothetical protein
MNLKNSFLLIIVIKEYDFWLYLKLDEVVFVIYIKWIIKLRIVWGQDTLDYGVSREKKNVNVKLWDIEFDSYIKKSYTKFFWKGVSIYVYSFVKGGRIEHIYKFHQEGQW